MSTSPPKGGRRSLARAGFAYLLAALFCALFGAVYALFGHGVYSYFMMYAFAFPLAGGALPCWGLALSRRGKLPGKAVSLLWRCGIATLTAGSLVTGVLEIYGTTNRLTLAYWLAGGGLLAACAAVYLLEPRFSRK